jgi:hypothetical protein
MQLQKFNIVIVFVVSVVTLAASVSLNYLDNNGWLAGAG